MTYWCYREYTYRYVIMDSSEFTIAKLLSQSGQKIKLLIGTILQASRKSVCHSNRIA
jgi:hypothetical protein